MVDYFKEDKYWERHISDELEFDDWINKYLDYLPLKGSVLDLGCGKGEYSKYFIDKGYNVVSADISSIALDSVKEFNNNIVKLDMREKLPFDNDYFEIVFANLSIHYFNEKDTIELVNEIYRILKKNGLFIGSVNSIKALEFIKDHTNELEYHYYQSNERKVRLFDLDDIDYYFSKFHKLFVKEEINNRFNKRKDYIIFIMKK